MGQRRACPSGPLACWVPVGGAEQPSGARPTLLKHADALAGENRPGLQLRLRRLSRGRHSLCKDGDRCSKGTGPGRPGRAAAGG